MINNSHTYTQQGTYTVRLVNTKNFQPTLKPSDFDISIDDIENGSKEARENLRFEALKHINKFNPNIDLEEFANVFDESYEEHYKELAEDKYIFNKYAKYKLVSVKPAIGTRIIKKYAYLNNFELQTIDLNNIKTIEDFAFAGCSKLGSLNINESYAYPTVTLPNTLKSIGRYAFASCSSLKTIIIPKSVESIGYGAFYNCKNLKLIIFENRSQEDVLMDFHERFMYDVEDNSILNDITSTKGTIVFGATISEQELTQIINQLDEQQNDNNINISNANSDDETSDPYSDKPPCPLENNNETNDENNGGINISEITLPKINLSYSSNGTSVTIIHFDTIPWSITEADGTVRNLTEEEITYWKVIKETEEAIQKAQTGRNVIIQYYMTTTSCPTGDCDAIGQEPEVSVKIGKTWDREDPTTYDPTDPINICSGVPIPKDDNEHVPTIQDLQNNPRSLINNNYNKPSSEPAINVAH